MRCYICDRSLSEKEIQFDGTPPKTEPCGECLEIIYDTAYPAGFDPSDDEFILIDEPVDEGVRDVLPFYDTKGDLDYD